MCCLAAEGSSLEQSGQHTCLNHSLRSGTLTKTLCNLQRCCTELEQQDFGKGQLAAAEPRTAEQLEISASSLCKCYVGAVKWFCTFFGRMLTHTYLH